MISGSRETLQAARSAAFNRSRHGCRLRRWLEALRRTHYPAGRNLDGSRPAKSSKC